jgi:hypothetical protein
MRGEQREADGHAARSTSSLRAADECTFTRTVRRMRDLGCAVNRVQDLGMAGASGLMFKNRAHGPGPR